mgnify:CR=1 FL=1
MNKHKNYSILTIIFLFFLCSCVSKKELLYLQDIQALNNSKVLSSKNSLQENDILKIDVTSLEKRETIWRNSLRLQLSW